MRDMSVRLLPAAQRMYVERQALDRPYVESGMPGRHHTRPRRGDLCDHNSPVVAVEVDARGQTRRTLLAIALSCLAVANRTVVGEQLRSGRYVLGGLRTSVQRHHVISDLLDLGWLQNAIGAEAWHLRFARLVVAAANTIGDGLLNLVERAAPDPCASSERWITRLAAAAGGMAGLAVVGESDASRRQGGRHELRVVANFD